MKLTLSVVVFWLAFGICTVHAEPIDVESVQKAISVMLLTDASGKSSRLGAISIQKFYPADESLTDLIAEKLSLAVNVAFEPKLLPTIKSYVDALERTHNARYRNILLSVRNWTIDKSLNKHIQEVLPTLGNSTTEFVPGQIDLEQQRANSQQPTSAGQQ